MATPAFLRHALRSVRRSPGFAATAILTLALGIGANTAIFSVVYGALLRPLPYVEPDRVMRIADRWHTQARGGSSMSVSNYLDLKERARSLDGFAAYSAQAFNLSFGDEPARVTGMDITHDLFAVLGARPQLGRFFAPEDDVEGAERVVVLSDRLWRDRFQADPGVVGRVVSLNAEPHTVIGVTARDFTFGGEPQIFRTFSWTAQQRETRGSRYISGIGRLAPGATAEGARAELMSLFDELAREYPGANENWSVDLYPLRLAVVGRSSNTILLLAGAVGLVLLIACANVANLMLARAESRQRELAIRSALGAGRARLILHFAGEGLVIALAGGLLGVGLAFAGVRVLLARFGGVVPRAAEIGIDGGVLAFTLLVSCLTGVLIGLVPALRPRPVGDALREGGRGHARGGSRLRRALVTAEIALAVVLVTGASLVLQSFWRAARTDTGLGDESRVLTVRFELPVARYDDLATVMAFHDRLLERVRALPGVEAAGEVNRLPFLSGNSNVTRVEPMGDPERWANFVELRYVSPGYFDAVGIPLLAGRAPEAFDADTSRAPVIWLSEGVARQLFDDGDAVGRRVDLKWMPDGYEVAGVVGDVREFGPDRAPPPAMYFVAGTAFSQPLAMSLVVRGAGGDPLALLPAVRGILRDLDPDVPLHRPMSLAGLIDESLGDRRFAFSLLGLFAALALLLGAVGIYGVMAYDVAQRTREMGIRLAVGADRRDIVRLVLRGAGGLTVFGLAIGLAGALAAGRLLSGLLYEIEPTDARTLGVVLAVMLGAALFACWVPARRAARVPPLEALRID